MGEAVGSDREPAETTWTVSDTEQVECCLCHVPGVLVHELSPFGLVRCPVCDLSFISPRLTADALQRLYDEPAYFEGGVYGSQRKWSPAMALQNAWTAGRLAELDRIRPADSSPEPARLLEIGSGYGLFLAAAREHGYNVSGVELSRTGVARSGELGLQVFCGQLGDAPEPMGKLDVICFWDTLEHVPNPLAFLRAVRGRLAEDGVFALSVPYVSSVPARTLGRRWWSLKPEQHIWHFTPATLRVLAARAGLVVTSVTTSPLKQSNFGRLDSLVAVGRALPRSADLACDQ